MKRKSGFMMAVVTIIVAAAVAGCAGKMSNEEQNLKEEPDKMTLEIYAWQDEQNNVELLADQFMEENPDINININIVPVTEYVQQIRILKSRNKQVDCIFYPTVAGASVLKSRGLIKNLEPWMTQNEIENQYNEWDLEGEKESRSYMMPYRMSGWCVYYNKKIFDRLGVPYPKEDWTWEEYEETAVRLTEKIDGTQIYGSLSFEPNSIWWRIPARTAGADNPFIKEDIEEFRKAAEWCSYLTYDLGVQMPYSERTGTSGYGYEGMFLNGNIGMYFCGDWSVKVLNEAIEKNYPDFEYDIVPLPHWEGKDAYIIKDAAVVSMAESTEYPNEVYKFMEFAAGPVGAKILASNSVLPAWNSQEVMDAFSEAVIMPEHSDYFFKKGNVSRVPAEARYDEAMEIIRDEVALYLLREQDINRTFENIGQELENLE